MGHHLGIIQRTTSLNIMKAFFVAIFIVASALKAKADVTVSVPTVMCNCGTFGTYNYYNAAATDCANYPTGAGFGSCVANSLGFLNVDGRSADVDGLKGKYGADADNCDSGAISAANLEAKGWAWPGSFDFVALDSALSAFFTCANDAAVQACENSLKAQLQRA